MIGVNYVKATAALQVDQFFGNRDRISQAGARIVRLWINDCHDNYKLTLSRIYNNPVVATIAYLHKYYPHDPAMDDQLHYQFWNHVVNNVHKYVTEEDLHLLDETITYSQVEHIAKRLDLLEPRISSVELLIEYINYRLLLVSGRVCSEYSDDVGRWFFRHVRYEELDSPNIPYSQLI